jgi:hypothetical protein
MRKYLKFKINELAMKRKDIRELYRIMYQFERSYKPRSNSVKGENGDNNCILQ